MSSPLHLLTIFLAAILTHNIALTYLLGMCPFISLSKSLKTASGMGFAVIFVVFLTAAINWPVYHLILVPTNSTLIYYITFIIVIIYAGAMLMLTPRGIPEAPPAGTAARAVSSAIIWLFIGVVAANVIAIIFLEGFAGVLPDDPTSYNLIEQLSGR